MKGSFLELGFDIVPDIVAGDANSDLTGDWVKLTHYQRAYLVLVKPSGTAGDDLAIHLQQATDAAGTGVKDLIFEKLWYKKGSTNSFAAVPVWTAVTLTTPVSTLDLVSVNGVDLALDTSGAVVVVEVLAESLDIAGGFDWVNNIIEGDDIGNALIVNQFWLMAGGRFRAALPLSAIA